MIAAQAACVPPPRQGAPDIGELSEPISGGYFQIVSFAPDLVEIDADGALVRAKPPAGQCIPPESILTSDESVFLIYAACREIGKEAGVLSLSVSNAPMTAGFDAMAQFFRSEQGLAGLGHGGGAEDVTLLEIATGPHALYTLVEDRSQSGPSFAGEVISRAFTEVAGRMVVVTLITRKGETATADAMRARLAGVVAALQGANA